MNLYCDKDRPYVFISYSHADDKVVYDKLEKLHDVYGVNLWYDEEMNSGKWNKKAFAAMDDVMCHAVVLFASKNALTSENILKEIDNAVFMKKPLIIVNFEDTSFKKQLFEITSEYNRTDRSKVEIAKEMVQKHLKTEELYVPLNDYNKICSAIHDEAPQVFQLASVRQREPERVMPAADNALPEQSPASQNNIASDTPEITLKPETQKLVEQDANAAGIIGNVKQLAADILHKLNEQQIKHKINHIKISAAKNKPYYPCIEIRNYAQYICLNTTLDGKQISSAYVTITEPKEGKMIPKTQKIFQENFEEKNIYRSTQEIVTCSLQSFGKK